MRDLGSPAYLMQQRLRRNLFLGLSKQKSDTHHTFNESSIIVKQIAQEGFRQRAFTPFKTVGFLELTGGCTYSKEKNLIPLKRLSAVLRLEKKNLA